MSQLKIPTSLRKAKTELRYQEDKSNGNTIPLEQEPALHQWSRWKLINNRYPYDAVFSKHDMLIPSCTDGQTVNDADLHKILKQLENEYDFWFVNFSHRQSIKHLLHIHLVKHKEREDMAL